MRIARRARVLSLGASLIAVALSVSAFAEIGDAGVNGISTGSTAGISTGSINGISTGSVEGISTGSVNGISTGSTLGISTGSILGISTGSVEGISTGSVNGISTGSTLGISTGSILGISTGSVEGISTGSVASLSCAAAGTYGISTGSGSKQGGSVSGISTGSVNGISTGSTAGISTGSTAGISTGSVQGISTGSVAASCLLLAGPVDSVNLDAGSFSSLGQEVFAQRTVLDSLNVGDYVGVSGSIVGPGELDSHQVYHFGNQYVPGATDVFVTGFPSEIDARVGTARIGSLTVDYTPAMGGRVEGLSGVITAVGTQPVLGGVMLSRELRDSTDIIF